MAQAQIEQEGYFKSVELSIDEDFFVWVGRKKGQPAIVLYKRTKHSRLEIQLTPEQYDYLKSMVESIDLALSLIGTRSQDGSTTIQGSTRKGSTSI